MLSNHASGDGERRLLITVGMSPLPVILSILALEPKSVQMICTVRSQVVADRVRDFCEAQTSFEGDIIVLEDSPVSIREQLDREAKVPCDVAYAGGTTSISSNTLRWWHDKIGGEKEDGPASWYLADRGRELRSWGSRTIDVARSKGMPKSLESLFALHGVGFTKVESAFAATVTENQTVDSRFPFHEVSADGSNPVHELSQMVSSFSQSSKPHGAANWNACIGNNQNLMITGGQKNGFLLELTIFTVVCRYFLQVARETDFNPLFPIHIFLSTKIYDDGEGVAEVDVCVQYGPRLLVISCGIGRGGSLVANKYAEAKHRAHQLGGGEGRSITIGHRSDLKYEPGSDFSTHSSKMREIHVRKRGSVGVTDGFDGDRHSFFNLFEILPYLEGELRDEDSSDIVQRLEVGISDPTLISVGSGAGFYDRLRAVLL